METAAIPLLFGLSGEDIFMIIVVGGFLAVVFFLYLMFRRTLVAFEEGMKGED